MISNTKMSAYTMFTDTTEFVQIFKGETEYTMKVYDQERQLYEDNDILIVEEKNTGRFFTGKTPNDDPINEIIRQANVINSIWDRTAEEVEFQQSAENFDGIVFDGQYNNMEMVTEYNIITETDISVTKIFPQQFFPTPSLEDYKLGSFTRYFAVKVNELIYLELENNNNYIDILQLLCNKNELLDILNNLNIEELKIDIPNIEENIINIKQKLA